MHMLLFVLAGLCGIALLLWVAVLVLGFMSGISKILSEPRARS